MKAWIVLASVTIAPAVNAQQSLEHKSLEHKTCLFAAAEKLPNIAGMSVAGYRFVPSPGGPKAKAPGSDPLAVEIDATFLGTPATFLFVCASQVGGSLIVFSRGIVR
jgi:hypothetical protein